MTDEVQDAESPEAGETGGGGRSFVKIGIFAGVILGAAIAGFLVFRFVLAPMLGPPEEGDESDEDFLGLISPYTVAFDDGFVNLRREGDMAAATLLFGITLECSTQDTIDLIELYKPRFTDLLHKLHDSRTRAEVDDTLTFKKSVQKQALQKCNDLLKQIQGEETDHFVTAVFHHALAVQDGL